MRRAVEVDGGRCTQHGIGVAGIAKLGSRHRGVLQRAHRCLFMTCLNEISCRERSLGIRDRGPPMRAVDCFELTNKRLSSCFSSSRRDPSSGFRSAGMVAVRALPASYRRQAASVPLMTGARSALLKGHASCHRSFPCSCRICSLKIRTSCRTSEARGNKPGSC